MKHKFKIAVDVFMTIALLLLMSYQMIGSDVHEWIGVGMFVLFITHHILNMKWSRNLFHGRYSSYRIAQTILVVLIFFSIIGSMYSGMVLSRHVFASFPIAGNKHIARIVHMLAAYWGFLFMGLHLGFHWNVMVAMGGKLFSKKSKSRKIILRIAAVVIAGYGVYGFYSRQIFSCMFLQQGFVFFDFSEPLVMFLLDYLAILGFWVFVGYYIAKGIQKASHVFIDKKEKTLAR